MSTHIHVSVSVCACNMSDACSTTLCAAPQHHFVNASPFPFASPREHSPSPALVPRGRQHSPSPALVPLSKALATAGPLRRTLGSQATKSWSLCNSRPLLPPLPPPLPPPPPPLPPPPLSRHPLSSWASFPDVWWWTRCSSLISPSPLRLGAVAQAERFSRLGWSSVGALCVGGFCVVT